MKPYNLPTPTELAKNTISRALAFDGDWTQFVLNHRYSGSGVSRDLRVSLDGGQVLHCSMSIDGCDVPGYGIGEYGLDDHVDGGVIVNVDKGGARFHSVSDSKIVFQFNGSNQSVDKDVLMKSEFVDVSPERMIDMRGFYELKACNNGRVSFDKCDDDFATEMMDEWVHELAKRSEMCSKSPVSVLSLYDMLEHFEMNSITHMAELGADIGCSRRTVYRYRELLGF